MARGFSKAILCGNLTRDPDLRATPSGAQVCSLSLAVNRVFKDSSGSNKESVSFFDCVAWGKQGEAIAQYAKKGSGMLVSGRLEQRSWEDKNSGQRRSRVELVIEDFNFIGNNSNAGGGNYDTSEGVDMAPSDDVNQEPSESADGGSQEAEVVPDDIPSGEGEVKLDDIPF